MAFNADIRDKKIKTINHLLNIDTLTGGHDGRVTPLLIFAAAVLVPALFLWTIFINLRDLLGGNGKLAATIIIVGYLLYIIRVALLTFGNEKARKARYKKQLYSVYEQPGEYVKIKNIYHEDGCIEFFDGSIAYIVVALNGNMETFSKFTKIQKFLEVMEYYSFDVLVQNTASGASLDPFYTKIKNFKDREAAQDFLAILDYNKQYITNKSQIVRIAYVFYGKPYERIKLHDALKDSLPDTAYFDVHIASREEALDVLIHDMQLYFDIDDLIMNRYSTGTYYTSRVIAFDDEGEAKIMKKGSGHGVDIRSFIPQRR